MQKPYRILFICTGNSVRSLMAEALINVEGRGLFRGYSAGPRPVEQVDAGTLALLQQKGIDTTPLRSKSWLEFAGPGGPAMDFIFTLSDQTGGEDCPTWPGVEVNGNWEVPDPLAIGDRQAAEMAGLEKTFRQVLRLVRLLCVISPSTLDRMALTWKPDQTHRRETIPPRLASGWASPKAAEPPAPAITLMGRRRGRPPKNAATL